MLMGIAAAFFLAAAAASQAAPVAVKEGNGSGPVLETARVAVEILRPAVLRAGELADVRGADAPRSQRQSRGGRITYEFE